MGHGFVHDGFDEHDVYMTADNMASGFMMDDDMSQDWVTDSEMGDEDFMSSDDMAKCHAITNNVMHTLMTGEDAPHGMFHKGFNHLRRKSVDLARGVSNMGKRSLKATDELEHNGKKKVRGFKGRLVAGYKGLRGTNQEAVDKKAAKAEQKEIEMQSHVGNKIKSDYHESMARTEELKKDFIICIMANMEKCCKSKTEWPLHIATLITTIFEI